MQSERITTENETYTKVYTPLDNHINWMEKEGYKVETLHFTDGVAEYVCVVSTHRRPIISKQIDIFDNLSGVKVTSFEAMKGMLHVIARHQQEEK